jgi:hypothetical protein
MTPMLATMLAYHNDPAIKSALIASLEDHAAHDRIKQGSYWQDGKGCAVACTLQGVDEIAAIHGKHQMYEVYFGVPQAIARLEDRIFEGLDNTLAMRWPLRFAAAIRPGADLSMVVPRFLRWLLSERLLLRVTKDKYPRAWQAIADVATLYREWCVDGVRPSRDRFEEAAAADADAAADAAAAYAAYAAYAADAYAAADADAAAAAADAAAAYAAYAAYAAAAYAAAAADAYAAAAAADAAAAYAADAAAADAAHKAEFSLMADKLIELLEAA